MLFHCKAHQTIRGRFAGSCARLQSHLPHRQTFRSITRIPYASDFIPYRPSYSIGNLRLATRCVSSCRDVHFKRATSVTGQRKFTYKLKDRFGDDIKRNVLQRRASDRFQTGRRAVRHRSYSKDEKESWQGRVSGQVAGIPGKVQLMG